MLIRGILLISISVVVSNVNEVINHLIYLLPYLIVFHIIQIVSRLEYWCSYNTIKY